MIEYLPNKYQGETVLASVDFASRLPPGVTITSVSTAITLHSGTDPTFYMVVNGVLPTFSGSVVSQLVTGGVIGAQYLLVFAAVLSDGETMEEARLLRVVDFD